VIAATPALTADGIAGRGFVQQSTTLLGAEMARPGR
jgi:hypothetical protein